MNSKLRFSVLMCGLVGGFAACTFPSSRTTIPASQAGVMQQVSLGTVSNVREVNIEGQKGNLGLMGGGAMGAAVARPSPGSGRAAAVGQAAGAVVGAVAGQAVEEVATRKRAQELTVQLDDGQTVVVTQETNGGMFRDGDRVRILHGGGGARVSMAGN